MRTNLIALLSLCLGIGVFWANNHSDYMREEFRDVCVVNKYEGSHKHKSRIYADYYLVMKEPSNRIFKRDVSQDLYVRKDVGSCFKFNLREFDIKQTVKGNILYFFLPAILGSVFIAVGLSLLLVNVMSGKRED